MSNQTPFFQKSILLIALALLTTPAFAGDETAVTTQSTLSTTASNGASNADILRQLRQDMITQKINVFRSTVRTTTKTKTFFARLVSSSANPIDAELLRDMNQFTVQYLSLPETAEAFHLSALVQQRSENYPAAALSWLLVQIIYPDSPFAIEAAKQLKELSNDGLKKQSVLLSNMAKTISTLNGNRDQRMAAFLQYLGKLNDDSFAPAIMAVGENFLISNDNFLKEDLIEHAIARQAMLVDNQIAIYHFNRLLAFYPDSTLRADSFWSLGTLQRKGMKQFDLAAKSFAKVIEQYPESPEAKFAIEALAQMYAEDMSDFPNALKTHQAIIAKYNTDPLVLRSLSSMALIYQNKTNEPAKAIDSYLKIADMFKGGEALDALIKAEKITTNSTKNWKQAIEINNRIVALVPTTEESAKALFSNGDIAENKLNDKEQAKKYYADLITRQPAHPLAKEANDRLNALTPTVAVPPKTPATK